MHDNDEVLPEDGLYLPAGQAMHDEDDVLPMEGLYVPDWQAAQEL
jgi:hypothetical protein